LTGTPGQVAVEPVVGVPVEGFLPEEYVPEVNQRLAVYKRLTAATDAAAVADLQAELEDRFGPLPPPAAQLLDIVRIRVAARVLGIERLEVGEGKALVTFSSATQIAPERLVRAIQQSRGRLRMKREFTLEASIARGEWPVVRDALLQLLGGLQAA
jgi:transcription-repair coupling factor (superfamily II helicase)